MEARVFIEPQQGASYAQVKALAQRAEELGFDGFFSSDHYLKMGDGTGLPGPLDAWTTLTGLARDTKQLRLGTLVSPITFHHPAQLAMRVAQIDDMSGGRVELGLGAGWFEDEHRSHGIAFPNIHERFDRLTEGLDIVAGMWSTPPGELFSYDGNYFQLDGSPGLPKPIQQPNPPIIIGGRGKRRTPQLVAQHASEFNLAFADPDDWKAVRSHVTAVCEANGRDPSTVVWSAVQVAAVGRTAAEFTQRAKEHRARSR